MSILIQYSQSSLARADFSHQEQMLEVNCSTHPLRQLGRGSHHMCVGSGLESSQTYANDGEKKLAFMQRFTPGNFNSPHD